MICTIHTRFWSWLCESHCCYFRFCFVGVFRKRNETQNSTFLEKVARLSTFSLRQEQIHFQSVRHKIKNHHLTFARLFATFHYLSSRRTNIFIFPVYCLFCHSQQIIQIRSIFWENGPINNIESPSFSSTFDTEIAHKSALLSENQEIAEMGHL